MNDRTFYCKGDGIERHYDEIPSTLKPFYGHVFSSGGVVGEDFVAFDRKYKNVIKKLLPDGYTLHQWHKGHYESSFVIKDEQNRFIYGAFSDVRVWDDWLKNILVRTMKNEKDWSGGTNCRTSLFTFGSDIKTLYR